jgi:hypothetical protein
MKKQVGMKPFCFGIVVIARTFSFHYKLPRFTPFVIQKRNILWEINFISLEILSVVCP